MDNFLEKKILGKEIKDILLETIIVVISILIAFLLNNWWSGKQDLKAEANIKESLNHDFVYNRDTLKLIIEETEIAINSAIDILKLDVEDYTDLSNQLFDSLLYNSLYVPQYEPAMGALQDILNSGKLHLIQNKNLRARVASFTSHIAEKNNMEWIAMKRVEDFVVKYLYEHISFLQIDRQFASYKDQLKDIPEMDHHTEILSSRQFRNFVTDQIFSLHQFKNEYNSLAIHIDHIIKETTPE